MGTSHLFCSPEEFWDRLKLILNTFDLSCFERNQRAGEVRALSPEELNSSHIMEWQWDLWIAKIIPPSSLSSIPARDGWILFCPPLVNESKKIIRDCYFGAKVTWPSEGAIFENPELKALLPKVKSRFLKGSITAEAEYLWKNHAPTLDKVRFTPDALIKQKEGWTFMCTSASCLIRIPDSSLTDKA